MPAKATGTFEVKMTPLSWSDASPDPTFGRFALDKLFHGDLEASSQGQMMTAGTVEKGSAGYVALEKVTGTLNGRQGSFVLQHNGIMNRGIPQLTVAVVPDSGTAALVGLSGTLTILRADGKHSYEFDYSLLTAD